MPPQFIQIGSQTIAYYETNGEPPGVMLIHGNSSSALIFRNQLESSLGEEFRLVAIDLPGHGHSSWATNPQATYTLPGYASFLVSIAERLNLTEAVLVGWNLGGHIILEASRQLPGAPGLMIFGTPPLEQPADLSAALLPHLTKNHIFTAELPEREVKKWMTACFKPDLVEVPQRSMADVRRTDRQVRSILGQSIVAGNYQDEVEIVSRLTRPLGILHGEQDQLINRAYIEALTIPTLWRGAVQLIPEAGHSPQWEQPARFNTRLKIFIEEMLR